MRMSKINPTIRAEWESYRGKTITTANGFTLDMEYLARFAYQKAVDACQGLEECINSLHEQKSDQEHFHGVTPYTVELGITIARLEAEMFGFVMMAYKKYARELGLGNPLGSGLLDMVEHSNRGRVEIDRNMPQNDNEPAVSEAKKLSRSKPRQKKALQK